VTRQEPPPWPEHKPVSEMMPEEVRDHARELQRRARQKLAELEWRERERKLRQGLVKPRNNREWEIFASTHRVRVLTRLPAGSGNAEARLCVIRPWHRP
jgi:hypothetical protein